MKKSILWCLLMLPVFLIAQVYGPVETRDEPNLFVGYIAAGMNATQIAGDLMAGYRKVGANAGVGAHIMYTPVFSNSIELSYSMKVVRRILKTTTRSILENLVLITWRYLYCLIIMKVI